MNVGLEEQLLHTELWKGELPIMLHMARDEVMTDAACTPDPVFVMAPRLSYLPLACAAAVEYFRAAFAPPHIDGVWFECDGVPCKWQLPLGVLYDLMTVRRDARTKAGAQQASGEDASPLPWRLTLHFLAFPANLIMRCPDEHTVKRHFLNNLKEANYLKHGDNSRTNDLSLQEQDDMWEAIKTNDASLFWSVNTKLTPADSFRNVPVRVCRNGKPMIQEPIAHWKEGTESLTTLGDVLVQTLPQWFGTPEAAAEVAVEVQGVRALLHTPISWLSYHCSHPDNFLYVCVARQDESVAE
eukprot:TRINITY_DN162_c1_g1_i1.p1 TRINITY_DN162_c1_g1~~TRINITY_DN162_c1_g1_i1.p1  ORF type:complete len:298 (-),score=109.47 TRINITY_DN162_c1_g1_i1:38-931(-)